MTFVDDTKAQLRQQIRAARREALVTLTAEQATARAETLMRSVLADSAVAEACSSGAVITAFASLPTEPPTALLLQELTDRGATVLLPIVGADRGLSWARYEGASHLHPATMQIPEPDGDVVATNADDLMTFGVRVMLLPGLAVDETGARLGQGGGYYDTLLGSLPTADHGGPTRIAIVGPGEVLPPRTIPMQPHDQRIDRVIIA
jgi:5-formyltetrahydrofolate cyclo-ligase